MYEAIGRQVNVKSLQDIVWKMQATLNKLIIWCISKLYKIE